MDTFSIEYCFTFPDNKEETVHLEVDTTTFELVNNIPSQLPYWTSLDFHQCSHCPLDKQVHLRCPLASNMVNIVKRLTAFLPYQKLHLDVITKERAFSHDTTLQAAVGSLMGFVMPTSGCPYTAYFKPMARFHVPLASSAETIYRSVSMYVMAQYFLYNDEQKPIDTELKGLAKIYEDLHEVNTTMAERFLAASKQDSSVDAIVQLDIYAMTFLGIPEDPLNELKHLFEAFFHK